MIIYENEESLIRLQELIKIPKTFSGIKITLRQLDPTTDDYRCVRIPPSPVVNNQRFITYIF